MTDRLSMEEVLDRDRGILEHFGMQVLTLGAGTCELQATVKPELINAAGFAHGGLMFAVADSACAYATGSLGARGATISSGFNFCKAARAGMTIHCVAEVISRSRRLVTLGARLSDASDQQLLAHGTFTFMLLTD